MNHQIQAETFLNSLLEDLMDCITLEVDELPEGLSILSDSGQYLLNYHSVTDQLWLSSPVTGAHHFHYQESGWICTRTKQALTAVLQKELSSLGCILKRLS